MNQQSLKQKAADAAWEFLRLKKEYDQGQEEFNRKKKTFYEIMEEYFGKNKCSSARFYGTGMDKGELVVKKIEKTSIEWDAEKLEKRVDKSIAKQVIKRHYRISDMQGLIQYLKSCGVNPVIFKKFILVDKSVDEEAVNWLGDIGQLSVNQISGCYVVKANKPYFTITAKKSDEWQ